MSTQATSVNGKTAVAEPAYLKIKNFVLSQIQNGVWQEGDLIPTEMALCEQFQVSRMTVNRALRELTADQLLIRIKGSGTYVAQPKYQSTLIEIRSIAQDIRERGHRHTSRVLSLEKKTPTSSQLQRLGLKADTQLYHSLIVHYDNGVPIQLEDRVVDAAVAPDYLKQDWEQMTPNEYLMRVAPLPTGKYTIEVRFPAPEQAEALDISTDQPCLVMDRVTSSNGRFTSHATTWHPGNRYRFTGKI